MNKKIKNVAYALITLLLLMFTFILYITGVFEGLERNFIDFRLSFGQEKNINSNIVRLHMDDLESYKLENYRAYTKLASGKLSRNDLSKLIDYLEKAEPKLIILDFNLNNYEEGAFNFSNPDITLSKTLQNYDNIIISMQLNKDDSEETEFPDYSIFNKTSAMLDVLVEDDDFDRNNSYVVNENVPVLFMENQQLTVANFEGVDRKIREVKPVYKISDKDLYLPSSALYAFLKMKNKNNSRIVIKDKKLFIDNFVIRLNDNYNLYLNLKDKTLYYPSYPIGALLTSIYERKDSFVFDNKTISRDSLKNKVIIIEEDPANVAIKELPNNEKYTNAEIMALELDNYLSYYEKPSLKTQFPVNGSAFIAFLLTVIFCAFIIISKLTTRLNYLGFIFTLVYVFIVIVYYLQAKVLIPMAMPLYFMLLFAVANIFVDKFFQNKQNDAVKTLYRQHLSKEMLGRLTRNLDEISLQPQMQFITAMYCKIENFNALTKEVAPEVLISGLNEVLDIAVTSSLKNRGTVNKISSNSLIVYFGAPISDTCSAKDAQNAAKTAIDIWNKVNLFNQRSLRDNQFSFDFKIALHSGEALVGEIGSNSFSGYSAFGETIELVHQISKISSQFEKSLLISQSTYNLLKEKNISALTDKDIELAYAGAVSVKNNETAVKLSLYEVRYLAEAPSQEEA